MWKRNWTIFGGRKLLSMTSSSELWIITILFSFRINSFYTALIMSFEISLKIVFSLLSVPSSLPLGVTLLRVKCLSFNNRTYAENEAGWDVSVQCLKWEACEICSINKYRDASFTHTLKHPPAINFPIRTSMESVPSLKQHFYDYRTIISLGLFQFHLLRLSAKSLFPASDEFALILPGHLFTWRESISWMKHK